MVRYSIEGFKKYVGCYETEAQALQALERSLAVEILDPELRKIKRCQAGLESARNTL